MIDKTIFWLLFLTSTKVLADWRSVDGFEREDFLAEDEISKLVKKFQADEKPGAVAFANLWAQVLNPEFVIETLKSGSNKTECTLALAGLAYNRTQTLARMIDASGKPGTTGLLDANLHAFGTFDECIDIHESDVQIGGIDVPDIYGRYVFATLFPVDISSGKRLPNLRYHDDYGLLNGGTVIEDFLLGLILSSPRLGVCVPSLCSGEAVETALNTLLNRVLGAIHMENFGIWFQYDVGENTYLVDDNTDLEPGAIAALILLSIIILLAIIGTFVDVMAKSKPTDIMRRILVCFSVYTNGKKLLSTKKSDGTIDCINGIRFLSMCWVVLGHTWYVATLIPWKNVFGVFDVYNDTGMMLILGGPLSVDSFFFLSGFLMSFLLLKTLEKTQGRGFIVQTVQSYVHRYIRLTPAYALIMLMFSTLSVYIGSGPMWNFLISEREKCAQNWWANLLYINNYVDPDNMCMGESWYLACDFQLFLIGPLLVYPMWKMGVFGLAVPALALVVSIVVPGVLTAVKDWPAQQTVSRLSADWFKGFYITTYTRASPYMCGIILGYAMHHFMKRERQTVAKPIMIAGWILSTGLCLAPLLGLKDYWTINFIAGSPESLYSPKDGAYAALGRLSWSLGLSWIVFVCANGNGGIVNKILSWKFFAPLSRLTFCTYLIHLHVMFIFHFGQKDVMVFGQYLLVNLFFSHLMLSFILAICCTLLFESPFIGLEKIVFGRKPSRPAPKPEVPKVMIEEFETSKNGIKNPTFTLSGEDNI